jgi:hypothetical protein
MTRVCFILLLHYCYFLYSYYHVIDTHFFYLFYFILYCHEQLSILVHRGRLCWNLNSQLLTRSLLIHWLCFIVLNIIFILFDCWWNAWVDLWAKPNSVFDRLILTRFINVILSILGRSKTRESRSSCAWKIKLCSKSIECTYKKTNITN